MMKIKSGDKGMSNRTRNHITVPNDPPQGPSLFVGIILLFIVPPVGTAIGAYMLFKRARSEWTRRQLRDFRHYAAIIGDRSAVSIRELANRLGKTDNEVVADIQSMINQGMIDQRAYIDRTAMLLYMQDDVIETEFVNPTVNVNVNVNSAPRDIPRPVETEYAAPQPKRAVPPKAKSAPVKLEKKPEEAPKRKQPAPRKPQADSEDFEAKLREIRELNDAIENEMVSQRIDRIGALTASIFRVVREKPERADEVRKFMNYYLPTTLKLLKSYSLMEKQSYQGENIQASRKKIEDVLNTLVYAFEQQQDRLFQSEAMDVEADISVLETMMASDGLTERGQGLRL